MKKLLIFFSAMVLALGVMGDTEVVDGITWTYTVSDGKASVGRASPSSGAIIIPSSLGGYTVTSIGEEAFYGCSGLTSVTIPSSVTSIGGAAFCDCSGLKTVYVDAGDADRICTMIDYSTGSGIDVSEIEFVENSGRFTGAKAAVFNGLVYDAEGVVCGIVQVTTGKATKKGVKVGGFVMLEDGKKQTIKSSTVAIEDGYVKVSTKVGKLGTAAITVGGRWI